MLTQKWLMQMLKKIKMKTHKRIIKTFEEFSSEIPKEGGKLRKRKPGDNIILGPDTQNPANQTDAAGGGPLAKYPFGGI